MPLASQVSDTSNSQSKTRKKPKIAEAQAIAQETLSSAQTVLIEEHKKQLTEVTASLSLLQRRRDEALDALSTQLAYLQDPSIFAAELFARAAAKIAPQTTADFTGIDVLAESFDAVEWEMPMIAPYSAIGALPM